MKNNNPHPLSSDRGSAVSAARTGDWSQAARHFRECSERSKALGSSVSSLAFLADAGLSLWKGGEYQQSFSVFVKLLRDLEHYPHKGHDLSARTLIKTTGFALFWIDGSLDEEPITKAAEPEPGFCSNPKSREDTHRLPDIHLDFLWLSLARIEYCLNTGSSLCEEVKGHLLDSRFPAVRYYAADLEIKHGFRTLQFETFPLQNDVLYKAHQELAEQKAKGKQLKGEPALTHDDNRYLIFQEDKPQLLFAALVALAAQGTVNPAIFETWRTKIYGRNDLNEINAWVAQAELILSLPTKEAITTMRDDKQDRQSRLLAALNVGTAGSVMPNDLFYAHVLVATTLLFQRMWANEVSDGLAALLSRRWLEKIEFRAALINPAFTVPEIESACKSKSSGVRKTAKILLAVASAVSTQLPHNMTMMLRNFAGD